MQTCLVRQLVSRIAQLSQLSRLKIQKHLQNLGKYISLLDGCYDMIWYLQIYLFRKSYRSNKNRRKQQRKLLSLKEGSTFEDFGLINALYNIIINTYKNIGLFRNNKTINVILL